MTMKKSSFSLVKCHCENEKANFFMKGCVSFAPFCFKYLFDLYLNCIKKDYFFVLFYSKFRNSKFPTEMEATN